MTWICNYWFKSYLTSKILMRLDVPIFWTFSASKCSYFVLIFDETFLPVNSGRSGDIGDIEYFNIYLEAQKAKYPNRTSDYITNDGFDYDKKIFTRIIKNFSFVFVFELYSLKMFLNYSYFFTNFSLFVFIKLVFI